MKYSKNWNKNQKKIAKYFLPAIPGRSTDKKRAAAHAEFIVKGGFPTLFRAVYGKMVIPPIAPPKWMEVAPIDMTFEIEVPTELERMQAEVARIEKFLENK